MSGLRLRQVAIVGTVALIGTLAVGVSPVSAATASQMFTYTGSEQTFTVPTGVRSVTVTAVGGRGGADGAAGL